MKKVESNKNPEDKSRIEIIWDSILYALRAIISSFLP